MVIFVALFCTTSVLSYLAAASIEGSKCAGQALPAGYRSGVVDFLAFPVFSAIWVGMLARVPAYFERESTSKAMETTDSIIVFEFLSIRISYGMFGFVLMIFSFLLILGMATRFCAIRYVDLSSYCQSVGAAGT